MATTAMRRMLMPNANASRFPIFQLLNMTSPIRARWASVCCGPGFREKVRAGTARRSASFCGFAAGRRGPAGVGGMFSARGAWLLLHAGGAANDFLHVEDQRHAPIAEDRRAGHSGHVAQKAAQRFHHHLAAAVELVDDDARPAALVLDDDDGLPPSAPAIEGEGMGDAKEGERRGGQIGTAWGRFR